MLPYRHLADTLGQGYLLVSVPFGKTQAEDALFLERQARHHKLHNVRQPLVLGVAFVA